jgi:dihydrolipoamide dehydrogenase
VVRFEETARTIIDGRTAGFCKLIAERGTRNILGCHVVGERAAEIVQAIALAMSAGMRVDALARAPLAFPTYAGVLSRAAYRAMRAIDPAFEAPVHQTDAGI